MDTHIGDTRPLDADPLDVWNLLPAELDYATRLRIARTVGAASSCQARRSMRRRVA